MLIFTVITDNHEVHNKCKFRCVVTNYNEYHITSNNMIVKCNDNEFEVSKRGRFISRGENIICEGEYILTKKDMKKSHVNIKFILIIDDSKYEYILPLTIIKPMMYYEVRSKKPGRHHGHIDIYTHNSSEAKCDGNVIITCNRVEETFDIIVIPGETVHNRIIIDKVDATTTFLIKFTCNGRSKIIPTTMRI